MILSRFTYQQPLFLATGIVLLLHFKDSVSMSPSSANNSRLVYGKDDALFGLIEEQQGNDQPFGNILDAGTGMHSLRWIATLGGEKGMTGFTAITADQTMQRNVRQEADALEVSHLGNVVIGNWFGHAPLEFGEVFDTVLADYLIGAMDGFSPYQQDLMIPKLVKCLKPGGKLYIVGLEPLPDKAEGAANIVCKVRQVRDACILLAGHRCYREYPVEWIERQIRAIPDLELVSTTNFPILYKHRTIVSQINVGRSKFPYFPTPEMADEMKKVMDDLEKQSFEASEKQGTFRLGFYYVIVAQKKIPEDSSCS
jgi:SAM-dependent methyltransferase